MGARVGVELLLCDTTVPMNFCGAGSECAKALEEFLGPGVYIVEDVREELVRKAEQGHAVLGEMLKTWPLDEAIPLPDIVRGKVADALSFNISQGLHKDEDIGETATVFYAQHRLKEDGSRFDLLMDDNGGKAMARARDLRFIDTPSLVLQMVCEGALTEENGQKVWNQALSDAVARSNYSIRLAEECPDRSGA